MVYESRRGGIYFDIFQPPWGSTGRLLDELDVLGVEIRVQVDIE